MIYEERESVVLENEGQKIFGVFHKPVGLGKFPAVLMCHGFAGQKAGKGRLYVMLSESFAKAGIATLRIDFRGCGDSEGDFKDMTLQSEVSDTLAGIHFLQSHSQVDAERVGLFGRSLGGLVAVLAAGKSSIRCLALWAPIYDGEQWLERWKGAKQDAAMVVEGQKAGLEFLRQLFALDMKKELEGIRHIPLLHVHGLKDQVVSLSHADHYHQERRSSGAESVYLRLKESDHEFSHAGEREELIQATLAWFKTHL